MSIPRNRVIIESVGAYTPENKVYFQDLLNGHKSQVEINRLKRILGLQFVRQELGHSSSSSLAIKAANNCLAKSSLSKDSIDLVVYGSVSLFDKQNKHHQLVPSPALHVKEECQLRAPFTLNLTNACAGMFTGIFIAKRLIESGLIKTALIVSGEQISDLGCSTLHSEANITLDSLANFTMSDGGAAVLLTRSDASSAAGIQDLSMRSYPEFASLCIGRISADSDSGASMCTKPQELYAQTERLFYPYLEQVLGDNIAYLDRDSWWIMHQASEAALQQSVSILPQMYPEEFSRDRFISTYREFGNTASTTHFVGLSHMLESQRLQKPFQVIFGIQASGLQLGVALIRFENHEDATQLKQQSSYLELKEALSIVCATTAKCENTIDSVGRCVQKALHSWNTVSMDSLIYVGIDKIEHTMEPALAALVAEKLHSDFSRSDDFICFDINDGACGLLKALALPPLQSNSLCRRVIVASENGTVGSLVCRKAKNNEVAIRGFFSCANTTPHPLWTIQIQKKNKAWQTEFRPETEWIQHFTDCLVNGLRSYEIDSGHQPKYILLPQCSSELIQFDCLASSIASMPPSAERCSNFAIPFYEAIASIEHIPPDTLLVAINSGNEFVALHLR